MGVVGRATVVRVVVSDARRVVVRALSLTAVVSTQAKTTNESLTGGQSVRRGDQPENLAARLSWIFADQCAHATTQQRQSVHRWQGRDRFYQQVQRAVKDDPDASDEARDVADDLTTLAAPLTQRVVVWRGIRSIDNTFGVPREKLASLIGRTFEVDQFFATTADRRVAEAEFTEPSTTPALYEIAVQAGTEAIWVPPLGAAEEARQQELLLLPGVETRIVAVDLLGELPIIEVEVSDG